MPMNSQASRHALEAQSAALQCDAGELTESKTLEPALAPEPRKSRLFPGQDPAKEATIGFLHPLDSGSLEVCRNAGRFGVAPSPLGEAPSLIEVGQGLAHLAIGAYALFQSGVVKLALRFQNLFQSAMLSFRGKKSVPKCDDHRQNVR